MSYCMFANEPGLQLTAKIKPLANLGWNLQVFQSFPCAANPRQQVVLNTTLQADDLRMLGAFLLQIPKESS